MLEHFAGPDNQSSQRRDWMVNLCYQTLPMPAVSQAADERYNGSGGKPATVARGTSRTRLGCRPPLTPATRARKTVQGGRCRCRRHGDWQTSSAARSITSSGALAKRAVAPGSSECTTPSHRRAKSASTNTSTSSNTGNTSWPRKGGGNDGKATAKGHDSPA